jgi:hypothetical protein
MMILMIITNTHIPLQTLDIENYDLKNHFINQSHNTLDRNTQKIENDMKIL